MFWKSSRARRLGALAVMLATLGLTGCEEVKKVTDFIDNISDGAPCENDYECLGGKCLKGGFAGGYCTTLNCEMSGCSGFFSECFRTKIEAQEITACFETCGLDGTCQRAAEGYQCVTLNDTPVCLPPGQTSAPVQGSIGSSCSATAQCNGEGAACLQSFFGGYCAIMGCSTDADCPDSNSCVPLNPAGATDADKKFACMKACTGNDDCRFGYGCQAYEGKNICLEGEGQDTVRNPNGADDGGACSSNINCKGGTCIREAQNAAGETSYPGGYCTTRSCDKDDQCNGDAVCVSIQRTTACRAKCAQDSDCRSGYACRANPNGGSSYCDSVADPPPVDTQATANSGQVKIDCVNSKSYTFDVPQGAVGFYLSPFTRSGQSVSITTLKKPDGSTLDVPKDYDFLAINPQILGSLSPILFPASDQTAFKTAFGAGSYTLNVNTSASEVCYYVIPQMQEGTKLALTIHLVGVDGVTAANAAGNTNIKQMLDMMKGIYTKMGITVTAAKFVDASSTVSQNYRIIRDLYDVFKLVATSTAPGEQLDDVLTVNVFLIEDFNIADAPGLLGISTGIPGVAGLHGTSGSGLVFSTASMGKDNASLGQTMAHEVGHFLGLRHTTEHQGSAHDPITDTPECLLPDLGFVCNDAENFMFPFSLDGGRQTKTSSGQSFVLRRNPLVRP